MFKTTNQFLLLWNDVNNEWWCSEMRKRKQQKKIFTTVRWKHAGVLTNGGTPSCSPIEWTWLMEDPASQYFTRNSYSPSKVEGVLVYQHFTNHNPPIYVTDSTIYQAAMNHRKSTIITHSFIPSCFLIPWPLFDHPWPIRSHQFYQSAHHYVQSPIISLATTNHNSEPSLALLHHC